MESKQRLRLSVLCVYLILALGCATAGLEKRVAKLEAQVEDLSDIGLMDRAAEVGAATRMYGRTALTGTDKSVANIVVGSLQDGDLCTVIDDNGYAYWYRWNASSTASQSVPTVIVPNSAPASGRWLLIPRIYASSFYSAAADGDHLVDPSNSNSLPSSPPTGALSVRDDTTIAYIADSSGNWWPLGFASEEYTTNYTLPVALHWGSTITNYGSTGVVMITLQKAVLGMEVNFHINVAQALRVDPNAADKFIGSGFTDGEYYWADGIGEYITIRAVQNGAASTDVDWAIINIGGVWTQQTP